MTPVKLTSILTKTVYKKGDRIVIAYEENGIFIGTVTMIRQNRIHILFDDGDKESVSKKSKTILGLGTKIKRKSAIPKKLLKKYLISIPSKRKVKPKIKPKRKKEIRKQRKVREKRVKKDKTSITKPNYKEVKHGSSEDKLDYLKELWTYLNITKFEKRMKIPKIIRFLTDKPLDKLKKHAHWIGIYREIGISRRIFNGTEQHLINLMLHEMCHQAVYEISKITRGSHGPHWKAWMKRVGLKPNIRANRDEADNMLSTNELKEKQNIIRKRNEAVDNAAVMSKDSLDLGVCVKFAYNSKPNLGRIVDIPKGKRKIKIRGIDNRLWTVNSILLHVCSEEERKLLLNSIDDKEVFSFAKMYDEQRKQAKNKRDIAKFRKQQAKLRKQIRGY